MTTEHRQAVTPRLPSHQCFTETPFDRLVRTLGDHQALRIDAEIRAELEALAMEPKINPAIGGPEKMPRVRYRLSDRELWLMAKAFEAGDNCGVPTPTNRGHRYTLMEWLRGYGELIRDMIPALPSREEYLAFHAPKSPPMHERYAVICNGNIRASGMTRDEAREIAEQEAKATGDRAWVVPSARHLEYCEVQPVKVVWVGADGED